MNKFTILYFALILLAIQAFTVQYSTRKSMLMTGSRTNSLGSAPKISKAEKIERAIAKRISYAKKFQLLYTEKEIAMFAKKKARKSLRSAIKNISKALSYKRHNKILVSFYKKLKKLVKKYPIPGAPKIIEEDDINAEDSDTDILDPNDKDDIDDEEEDDDDDDGEEEDDESEGDNLPGIKVPVLPDDEIKEPILEPIIDDNKDHDENKDDLIDIDNDDDEIDDEDNDNNDLDEDDSDEDDSDEDGDNNDKDEELDDINNDDNKEENKDLLTGPLPEDKDEEFCF